MSKAKAATAAPLGFDPNALDGINPAPENPYHMANLFLREQNLLHQNIPTVRYFRNEFYFWTATHPVWTPRSVESVCRTIMRWLATNPTYDTPTTHRSREIAASLSGITCYPDDAPYPAWLGPRLDTAPICPIPFLSFNNGLLDINSLIAGAPKIIPPTPLWFSPHHLSTEYNANAACPKWLSFLDRCLEADPERIALLQEWFGYCLIPDTSMQKIMCLEGDGANGKSVAVEVLQKLLGHKNVSHVSLEIFGQRFQFTPMIDKLLNTCGDVAELDKVAEGRLKDYISGGPTYTDRKGKEGVSFIPTARLIMAWNARPRFYDRTEGIWRRLIVMPWRIQIPRPEQNPLFVASSHARWHFLDELSGIAQWALSGLVRLYTQNDFSQSHLCNRALESYREESSPALIFLRSNYVYDKTAKSPTTTDIYAEYRLWCTDNGYQPLAANSFGREIRRAFPKAKVLRTRTTDGFGTVYRGFRPKTL